MSIWTNIIIPKFLC